MQTNKFKIKYRYSVTPIEGLDGGKHNLDGMRRGKVHNLEVLKHKKNYV